jgi:hypothetical protein
MQIGKGCHLSYVEGGLKIYAFLTLALNDAGEWSSLYYNWLVCGVRATQ